MARTCAQTRRVGFEPATLGIQTPQRVPQRISLPSGSGKLRGQRGEKVVRFEVAPRFLNLVQQETGQSEVLEDGDHVGKCLVESDHVRVAGVEQTPVHAVQDRMRHLVCHDVMRQTGENQAPRQLVTRIGRRGVEIAEQDRGFGRRVERILLAQRMGVDAQPPDVSLARIVDPRSTFFAAALWPKHAPPEHVFEIGDRFHGDRVHHLLVKLRISGRR